MYALLLYPAQKYHIVIGLWLSYVSDVGWYDANDPTSN